jgi:hypothetical protein
VSILDHEIFGCDCAQRASPCGDCCAHQRCERRFAGAKTSRLGGAYELLGERPPRTYIAEGQGQCAASPEETVWKAAQGGARSQRLDLFRRDVAGIAPGSGRRQCCWINDDRADAGPLQIQRARQPNHAAAGDQGGRRPHCVRLIALGMPDSLRYTISSQGDPFREPTSMAWRLSGRHDAIRR